MSRLKTISDKLDYIAMGKLNAEQMEYICEINQEVNLKGKEIERLHSIIKEVREYIDKEYEENCIIVDYCDNPITPQDLYSNILEILDKENK